MKIYKIYKHTFPNNKVYIGITCCNINRRWRNGKGYKKQPLMWNAILKYGWENIKHEILEETNDYIEAQKEERRLIVEVYKSNDVKNGYNVDLGGKYQGLMSEKTKEKISRAVSGKNNGMYGKHRTEEEKEKLRKIHTGLRLSEASIEKLRLKNSGENNGMYGKHHSEESKMKNRLAHLGKKLSEDHRLKIKLNHADKTGHCWWNNGVNEKLCLKCPGEGWIKGQLLSTIEFNKNKISKLNKLRCKYKNIKCVETSEVFDNISEINKIHPEINSKSLRGAFEKGRFYFAGFHWVLNYNDNE